MTAKLDPDLLKVLLAAGIIPEIATDRDVALADTMLMHADGNWRRAVEMMKAYRKANPT